MKIFAVFIFQFLFRKIEANIVKIILYYLILNKYINEYNFILNIIKCIISMFEMHELFEFIINKLIVNLIINHSSNK